MSTSDVQAKAPPRISDRASQVDPNDRAKMPSSSLPGRINHQRTLTSVPTRDVSVRFEKTVSSAARECARGAHAIRLNRSGHLLQEASTGGARVLDATGGAERKNPRGEAFLFEHSAWMTCREIIELGNGFCAVALLERAQSVSKQSRLVTE
jgi:hypothetical protein